ncbi:MAG: aminopeptidase [Candidatus Latescibacterota bacterium]|jgi:bleomycin hydrolase|nr:MAG: aminopeptidase [Candidatus Latescibacterota bacterium]
MKSFRAALLVALCAAILAAPLAAFAQKAQSGISLEVLKDLERSFKLDERNRSLMNALTANDAKSLALNRELLQRQDEIFNYKVDAKGITNQKSSGRCWLFAGLNIMRPSVIKKFNLTAFQFSESYLFFWDKLEKANLFLDAAIELRDRPLDDRELQVLVKDPIPDGGWWSYVTALIDKYGAVPKDAMPETQSSGSTGQMNTFLARLLRRDAIELRAMAAKGAKLPALRARRDEMLRDVYRLLVLHLGVPPAEFVWRYEDKDNKIVETTHTPHSFYRDVVGVDLADYVSLFDHAAYPYLKYYRIKYCRNMTGIPDMDFVNVDAKAFKDYALAMLLAGEPVWFAADVGAENYSKGGLMQPGIYDYEALFGVAWDISKADKIRTFESSPNHAMVFVGVDTVGAKARKWRVENSWGSDAGKSGYWVMHDEWFDRYVYGVIVQRKYVPESVLAVLSTKPEILPAWDPMRELFK